MEGSRSEAEDDGGLDAAQNSGANGQRDRSLGSICCESPGDQMNVGNVVEVGLIETPRGKGTMGELGQGEESGARG